GEAGREDGEAAARERAVEEDMELPVRLGETLPQPCLPALYDGGEERDPGSRQRSLRRYDPTRQADLLAEDEREGGVFCIFGERGRQPVARRGLLVGVDLD